MSHQRAFPHLTPRLTADVIGEEGLDWSPEIGEQRGL